MFLEIALTYANTSSINKIMQYVFVSFDYICITLSYQFIKKRSWSNMFESKPRTLSIQGQRYIYWYIAINNTSVNSVARAWELVIN